MISSAVLDALLAAGATAEMIVAAVKADAATEEARKATKRAGNAERQRRFKAKGKTKNNDGNALPSVSNAEGVSPNDIYSNPLPQPLEVSNETSLPVSEIEVSDSPSLQPEHVVEAWNDMAHRRSLPKAKLTPERRRKLLARLKQHTVEDWTEAIGAIERNPWMHGDNDRGWRVDFDFLLQPKSFTKLIEGSYDRSNQAH